MRISDWSSDVCSSDLRLIGFLFLHHRRRCGGDRHGGGLFRTTLRRALGLLRRLLGRLLLGRLLRTLRGGLLRLLPGGLLGSLLLRPLLRLLLGGFLLCLLLLLYLFFVTLLLVVFLHRTLCPHTGS